MRQYLQRIKSVVVSQPLCAHHFTVLYNKKFFALVLLSTFQLNHSHIMYKLYMQDKKVSPTLSRFRSKDTNHGLADFLLLLLALRNLTIPFCNVRFTDVNCFFSFHHGDYTVVQCEDFKPRDILRGYAKYHVILARKFSNIMNCATLVGKPERYRLMFGLKSSKGMGSKSIEGTHR